MSLEIKWIDIELEYIDSYGERYWLSGFRAGHDGPCVYVSGQCACGSMEIGIIGDDRVT